MEERKPVISLDKVTFSIPGAMIIDNISADIHAGESIFITGNSGSGKSTLLKIAACLNYPTTGDIIVNGMSLKNASQPELIALHEKDGFVFQDSALISNLTILDNLALPMRWSKMMPEKEIRQKVNNIAEEMGLTRDLKNRPGALSMGERKLAAFARAILNKPSILFLDEPLANLDISGIRLVKRKIREYLTPQNTIITVAHDINFIKEFGTRLWIIKDGKLDKDISGEQLQELSNNEIS